MFLVCLTSFSVWYLNVVLTSASATLLQTDIISVFG